MKETTTKSVTLLIIVAALGYFVDIYDLVLFNIVKKQSLEALGYTGKTMEMHGITLFNWQMTGMLVGGILWGIIGDKKGRVTILFGSILLYSLANIGNAFVTDIKGYSILRFLAGLGLAGELGAGITLVSETMSKEKRGIGTMIIATVGTLGAVVAFLVGQKGHIINDLLGLNYQNWQIAYLIGGSLGLILLFMRAGAFESGMFKEALNNSGIKKGNLMLIFKSGKNIKKYLFSIAIGLPIWCVIGILISLANQFGEATLVTTPVTVAKAIFYAYIGLSLGDFVSGTLSQIFRSRKKVILGYLLFLLSLVLVFLYLKNQSQVYFYIMCFLIGFGSGYWALFVTNAAEQFGTNIRSTVANTVPNFVRGAVVPITLFYKALLPSMAIINSALIVSLVCFGLAILSTILMEETFGKDLDYLEA